MEQKKQKTRIFDSKLFWVIISLLASLSIWTYVASTENSVVTQIFRGVQVEIVGDVQQTCHPGVQRLVEKYDFLGIHG